MDLLNAGLLTTVILAKPLWMWLIFATVVVVLLAFDLGVLHRGSHEISVRESLLLSAFYISMGVAFGGWVWWSLGPQSGVEYLTGFVIEKSLSMDNIFVIAMIFGYFGIPRAYQYRVLFWGILAVILLRGAMIGIGASLVAQFGWILWIFAAFLVITGVKMLFASDKPYDIEGSPLLKMMRRRFRITDGLRGERFMVRERDLATGRMATALTPLFLVLILVNVADVIFAVDSVPAIFAITTDTYLVFTSNIFAILGLRALYFALAAMIERFAYLKYALALVLIFIGGKIVVADMLGIAKVPPAVSLGATFAILASGIAYSLWRTRKDAGAGIAAPVER
jgi:tellurite resistance protein TerC